MKAKIYKGDCLEIMKLIPDNSIDMILCDPPYGTTACAWDSVIDFDLMWKELNRVIKKNGAIALFGSEPFSSALRMSNIKNFKYDWIWSKPTGGNFVSLKFQPYKLHEIISVFSKNTHKYYPIMEKRTGSGLERVKGSYNTNTKGSDVIGGLASNHKGKSYSELRNPSSIQFFNNRDKDRGMHPTQKPVPLLQYLIKTYTKTGETVLDFTMGSGSTGEACRKEYRDFIGIEQDKKYFEICKQRLKACGCEMEIHE